MLWIPGAVLSLPRTLESISRNSAQKARVPKVLLWSGHRGSAHSQLFACVRSVGVSESELPPEQWVPPWGFSSWLHHCSPPFSFSPFASQKSSFWHRSSCSCLLPVPPGEELIYLDPHTTQPAVEPNDSSCLPDESFHCQHPPCRMSIAELDPSIAVVRSSCLFSSQLSIT